jgi:hypothetical protein
LWRQIERRIEEAPAPVREGLTGKRRLLAQALLECYAAYLLDLHVEPPRFALEPGPRPLATPLARLQAGQDRVISTLRHNSVPLDPFDRAVLGLLDGTHDEEALANALAKLAADGKLEPQQAHRGEQGEQGEQGARPLADPTAIGQALKEAVPASLDRLAKYALLVA